MKPLSAVRRAALLVALEGAALALLGAGYSVSGVGGHPEDRLATVLAGLLALLVGAALLLVARALGAGRTWAFSPTVVTQLLMLVVGIGLYQGAVYVAAVPVLLLAVVVLYLLATPEARSTYRDRA